MVFIDNRTLTIGPWKTLQGVVRVSSYSFLTLLHVLWELMTVFVCCPSKCHMTVFRYWAHHLHNALVLPEEDSDVMHIRTEALAIACFPVSMERPWVLMIEFVGPMDPGAQAPGPWHC